MASTAVLQWLRGVLWACACRQPVPQLPDEDHVRGGAARVVGKVHGWDRAPAWQEAALLEATSLGIQSSRRRQGHASSKVAEPRQQQQWQ